MRFKVFVALVAAVLLTSPAVLAAPADGGGCLVSGLALGPGQTVGYADLMARTPTERRVILEQLGPEAKSELWKAHFESYLDLRPELSSDQVAAVLAALDFVSQPEIYANGPAELGEQIAVIEKGIRDAFSPEEAEFLLVGVSGSDRVVELRASILEGRPGFVTRAQPVCSCSTQSDWCGLNRRCVSGGCVVQSSGCGFLGLYVCNGLCYIK